MGRNKEYRRTGSTENLSSGLHVYSVSGRRTYISAREWPAEPGIRCVRHHRREFDEQYKQEFEGWFPF